MHIAGIVFKIYIIISAASNLYNAFTGLITVILYLVWSYNSSWFKAHSV